MESFERDWKKVLKKHGAAFLHTTDAVSKVGIYEGWSEEQRDVFILDCVKAAGRHLARANRPDQVGRYGLLPVVSSVVLKDFNEVREELRGSPRNANELCLRETLGQVLLWGKEQAACNGYHLYFDQGEPFYGHLVQLLQSKKAKKGAWLLNRISSRTEADMRRTPALQLADLCAWRISHHQAVWQPKWLIKMLKNDHVIQWADKPTLRTFKPHVQEVWRSWDLPNRADTP